MLDQNRQIHSWNWRWNALACLALYLVALSFRLYDIGGPAPQPDELHWLSRGYKIIKVWRERDYTNLTTHLPHPGIPAAVVIAGGQWVAERYNARLGLSLSDPGGIDRLTSGRTAIALVASLNAPILFLAASTVLGGPVALIAGSLLAFDVQHIASSKVAHLDLMLTLLVTASAGCYLQWLIGGRVVWKLAAGIFWGLASATKPTAVLLLPALGLAHVVAYAISKRRQQFDVAANRTHPLLSWSDVWTPLLGLATFALLYTRLWHPVVRQGYRLNVFQGRQIWIDELGLLAAEWSLVCKTTLVGLVSIAAFALLRSLIPGSEPTRMARSGWYHLVHLSSLAAVALGSFLWIPQVLKNMLGFWMWTFGLQSERHHAYGRAWPAPPGGYTAFLLSKPSSMVVIGLGLALILLPGSFLRIRDRYEANRAIAISLSVFIALFFLLGLSTSTKQAWRYAMPVVPFLCLTAAYGLFEASTRVVQALSSKRQVAGRMVWQTALIAGIVLAQSYSAMAWAVNPELFFNFISGGLKAASERKSPLPFSAQNEVAEFLHRFAATNPHPPLRVTVVGDPQTLSYAYNRLHPHIPEKDKPVKIEAWSEHAPGQYVVLFESILHRLEDGGASLRKLPPVFSYRWRDVELVEVHPAVRPTTTEPIVLGASKSISHRSGKFEIDAASNLPMLAARVKRDKRGYTVSNAFVNVDAGKYRAFFDVAIPADLPDGTYNYTPPETDRAVARLALSKRCTTEVVLEDLVPGARKRIAVDCKFETPTYAQLNTYWYGKIPFAVYAIEIYAAEK